MSVALQIEPGRAYALQAIKDRRHWSAAAAPQVAAWLRWLETAKDLRPGTIETYEKRARHLLLLFPDTPLDEFTEADLIAALNKIPRVSRRAYRTAYISLFRTWAHNRDLIAKDPTKLLGEMRHPKQKYTETFTEAEVEALTGLPGEDGLRMLLMFDTGLRIGELCALRVRDVQPPRARRETIFEMVDIPEELLAIASELGLELRPAQKRQAEDWGQVVVLDGKGGKDRVVPLTARLAQAFADWSLLEAVKPGDYVFGHRKPGGADGMLHRREPLTPDALRNYFYAKLKEAGVRKLKPHTCRHTYATTLIRRGAPLAHVAKLLGHSSIQTTVDAYAHLVTEDLRGVVELLEAP